MYKRIFVPYDGTFLSHRALDEAMHIAKVSAGVIEAVCVVGKVAQLVDIDSGYVDQKVRRSDATTASLAAIEEAEIRFKAEGVIGTARAVDACGDDISDILALSAADCAAELIVMGTRGRVGIRRWILGSVAESVLRAANCPILLVPCKP